MITCQAQPPLFQGLFSRTLLKRPFMLRGTSGKGFPAPAPRLRPQRRERFRGWGGGGWGRVCVSLTHPLTSSSRENAQETPLLKCQTSVVVLADFHRNPKRAKRCLKTIKCVGGTVETQRPLQWIQINVYNTGLCYKYNT